MGTPATRGILKKDTWFKGAVDLLKANRMFAREFPRNLTECGGNLLFKEYPVTIMKIGKYSILLAHCCSS